MSEIDALRLAEKGELSTGSAWVDRLEDLGWLVQDENREYDIEYALTPAGHARLAQP